MFINKEHIVFNKYNNKKNNLNSNVNFFRRSIAFIIPAFNEEVTLAETLKALLKISTKEDIYIVDDGSTDNTPGIARKYTNNLLSLNTNKGKAHVLNTGIKYFELVKRYKYIMPIDADTIVTLKFLNNSLSILNADKNKEIASVVGKVLAVDHCWLTKYRLWEYEIAHLIHKSAQNITSAIMVCTGCATVYRSEVFAKIEIPEETMTEDMDLTFKIHRENIGRIVYAKEALVITQDPHSIKDYTKQLYRWYTGFWQCVEKHKIPWGGQSIDFEVGLVALEGLFNSLFIISYFLLAIFYLLPLGLENAYAIFIAPIIFDFFLFLLPTILFVVKRYKVWDIFKYIPLFYVVRVISTLVFLVSFFRIVLSININFKWYQAKRIQLITNLKVLGN